ncbi:protein phosphatase 2C domain-containing protein [Dictyobacter formicarum]|uniref:PPM-type phosphatase domain-containing protein n=1 Tax=Dictyobacter formicarum TaxID=2778368 RepID=A0ABQ3VK37_9CHLR|nr:protein phosphatase 2C domain-containing protein [Dictyobacter formicarum]GHO86579.1 hypothetical protein KSZ_45850 [Dictyobacter formicarum]
MLCPLCHTQNRDNAKFCKGCGQLLAVEVVAGVQPEAVAQQESTDQAQTQGTPPPSSPAEDADQVKAGPATQNGEAETAAPAAAQEETTAPEQHQEYAEIRNEQRENRDTGEDVSQAPTQILTPQQMLAFHARRWQQDSERERQTGKTYDDIADAPTLLIRPETTNGQQAETAAAVPSPDIADMPTTIYQNSTPQTEEATSADEQATQVSADESGSYATVPATAASEGPKEQPEVEVTDQKSEQAENVEVSAPQDEASAMPAKEDNLEPTNNEGELEPTTEQQTGETEKTVAGSSESLPLLEVGNTVGGRYEVTQVLSDAENEHIYVVADHQGYQHCWNCGSEQNAEGDEFCIDCGAELLNASYILHEYPLSSQQGGEAQVLQGAIVNTFVDQGVTYVVEQPQTSQTAFPNGVHLIAASDSDAGAVRRGEPNEDSTMTLVFERVHESISSPAGLFVVADGMGGHANGQGASRTTIALIAERVTRELLLAPLQAEKAGEEAPKTDDETYKELLRGAIEDANTTLCQINQKDKSDMGSTLTGFMIVGDHAYIFNVGDSRTYMLRDEKIYQLTNDHSLVGQLVAGGLIEPDEVYTHPQRNQIFRSIGDKQNVQVDLFTQQIHPGDILLSCSDGLWEMIRDPQIADILNQAPDPQAACAQLIEVANANGGEDNVSAVVVFVR